MPRRRTRRVRCGTSEPKRGGYEIVDKFAGKEIFISGVARRELQRWRRRADRDRARPEEEIDDYIERFSALMQQPLVLH